MRALAVALGTGCAVLVCAGAARADPISLNLYSESSGVRADAEAFASAGEAIDLGTLTLSGGSSVIIRVDGLQAGANVPVTFSVVDPAGNPFTALSVEILDPLSDGFDVADPSMQ